MAKSKSGGTRSYLRGRIGADVYSIGKDGKGKKQQVIRSLAEVVSNPQTTAQMRGRMIMSTVMQMQSKLAPFVDHSFDGVPTGQPSLSAFIKANYALIKADVAAHPASGNAFGLVDYRSKNAQVGPYQVSEGDFILGDNVVQSGNDQSGFVISDPDGRKTLGAYLNALDIDRNGYVTVLGFDSKTQRVNYFRARVKADAVLTTEVTSENINSLFDVEKSADVQFSVESGGSGLKIVPAYWGQTNGMLAIIATKFENGQYKHSRSFFNVAGATKPASDAVLPTYPTGTERFLNGGEL